MNAPILFDASVHLGQFCLNDERVRIGCKNSQIRLRSKNSDNLDKPLGFCTFEENTRTDHIIWGLKREEQDAFYPFMDVYHSVKEAGHVSLDEDKADVVMALQIAEQFKLPLSQALSCAVAVRYGAMIHTHYLDLLQPALVTYMKDHYGVIIEQPFADVEETFTENDNGHNLEEKYQDALALLRERKIDLLRICLNRTEQ